MKLELLKRICQLYEHTNSVYALKKICVINNLNYSILNSLGKKIQSGKIPLEKSEIKTTDLESGVYLIIFNNTKKTFTRKLVIN